MTTAILKYRSFFAGLSTIDYLHIKITNHVMVKEITKEKADEIIKEHNLQLVYSNKYGRIYSDSYFKTLLTNNSKYRYEIFKKIEG